MKKIIFALFIFAVSIQVQSENESAVNDESDLANETPQTVEIAGNVDFCRIKNFEKKMNSKYSESIGTLLMSDKFEVDSSRCANRECIPHTSVGQFGTQILNVDFEKKQFSIRGGQALIKATEKVELLKKYKDIEFADTIGESVSFSIIKTIRFEEMYSAEFKKFNVVCAPENCTLFIFESSQGPLIYTETIESNKTIQKRLIVNSNVSATFSGSGAETTFKSCEGND